MTYSPDRPNGVRALVGVVQHHRLVDLALGDRQQFDHHRARIGVPAEAHGADPELLLERDLQGNLYLLCLLAKSLRNFCYG